MSLAYLTLNPSPDFMRGKLAGWANTHQNPDMVGYICQDMNSFQITVSNPRLYFWSHTGWVKYNIDAGSCLLVLGLLDYES